MNRSMRMQSVALAVSVAIAGLAQAADADYGVTLGVGYTDNINRTSTNEEDQTMLAAGVDFSLAQNTAKLTALAAADLMYVDFTDNAYDSEVVGNLQAQATYRFSPERLHWFVQDNFGQVRGDPFAPVTPANRENINYFTTGPDLMARFGASMQGRLSGRYSKVSYEDRPFDNDKLGATASLLRNLSATSELSLNVRAENTDYDQSGPATPDVDRQDAFLGYRAMLSRTQGNIELGYTRMSRDGIERDSKGLLARVDLQRHITERSVLSLRAGQELTDAGENFRLQQEAGDVSLDLDAQSVFATADLFTTRYASLGWDITGRRTRLGAAIDYTQDTYEIQSNFDRRRTAVGVHVSRDLSPVLALNVRLSTANEEFRNSATQDFRESTGHAELAWQAGRRLSLSFQYDHVRRSADLSASDSQENRLWLQLRFGQGARSSGALPEVPQPTAPANSGS